MTSSRFIRRLGPLLLAFGLAFIGVLLLVQQGESDGTDAEVVSEVRVATVVATAEVAAGTPVSELGGSVEVRELPAPARAVGAVEALDGLPPGKLLTPLVPGQQVLISAVANDPLDDVGSGLVAVSVVLAPERWVGPVTTFGDEVRVYVVGGDEALPLTTAYVLSAPDPASVGAGQSVLLTLGVPAAEAGRLIGAVSTTGIWLASP
jgi:pilus assembly protein CpaB